MVTITKQKTRGNMNNKHTIFLRRKVQTTAAAYCFMQKNIVVKMVSKKISIEHCVLDTMGKDEPAEATENTSQAGILDTGETHQSRADSHKSRTHEGRK